MGIIHIAAPQRPFTTVTRVIVAVTLLALSALALRFQVDGRLKLRLRIRLIDSQTSDYFHASSTPQALAYKHDAGAHHASTADLPSPASWGGASVADLPSPASWRGRFAADLPSPTSWGGAAASPADLPSPTTSWGDASASVAELPSPTSWGHAYANSQTSSIKAVGSLQSNNTDSPHKALLNLESIVQTISDSIDNTINDTIQDTIYDIIHDTIYDNIYDSIHESIHESIRESIRDTVHHTIQNFQDSRHINRPTTTNPHADPLQTQHALRALLQAIANLINHLAKTENSDGGSKCGMLSRILALIDQVSILVGSLIRQGGVWSCPFFFTSREFDLTVSFDPHGHGLASEMRHEVQRQAGQAGQHSMEERESRKEHGWPYDGVKDSFVLLNLSLTGWEGHRQRFDEAGGGGIIVVNTYQDDLQGCRGHRAHDESSQVEQVQWHQYQQLERRSRITSVQYFVRRHVETESKSTHQQRWVTLSSGIDVAMKINVVSNVNQSTSMRGCDDDGDRLTCRYYNITSNTWLEDGCTLQDLGNGTNICTCTHLTEFAVFGEAQSCEKNGVAGLRAVIFVFAVLFFMISCAAGVQSVKLKVRQKLGTFVGRIHLFVIGQALGRTCACLVLAATPEPGYIMRYGVLIATITYSLTYLGFTHVAYYWIVKMRAARVIPSEPHKYLRWLYAIMNALVVIITWSVFFDTVGILLIPTICIAMMLVITTFGLLIAKDHWRMQAGDFRYDEITAQATVMGRLSLGLALSVLIQGILWIAVTFPGQGGSGTRVGGEALIAFTILYHAIETASEVLPIILFWKVVSRIMARMTISAEIRINSRSPGTSRVSSRAVSLVRTHGVSKTQPTVKVVNFGRRSRTPTRGRSVSVGFQKRRSFYNQNIDLTLPEPYPSPSPLTKPPKSHSHFQLHSGKDSVQKMKTLPLQSQTYDRKDCSNFPDYDPFRGRKILPLQSQSYDRKDSSDLPDPVDPRYGGPSPIRRMKIVPLQSQGYDRKNRSDLPDPVVNPKYGGPIRGRKILPLQSQSYDRKDSSDSNFPNPVKPIFGPIRSGDSKINTNGSGSTRAGIHSKKHSSLSMALSNLKSHSLAMSSPFLEKVQSRGKAIDRTLTEHRSLPDLSFSSTVPFTGESSNVVVQLPIGSQVIGSKTLYKLALKRQ